MKLSTDETLEIVQKLIELLQMPKYITSFTVDCSLESGLKVNCNYIPESSTSRDIVEF
jgi:hypothetical protein